MTKVGENLGNPKHCRAILVDGTVGGVQLAAPNPNRGQFCCYSPAGAVPVRLALDVAASSTRYTVIIAPSTDEGAYYEVPTFGNQVYTGAIYAIADTGSATVAVTELEML